MHLTTYSSDGHRLRAGAPVRLAGVEIGFVQTVRVRPELKDHPVEVVMTIDTPYDLKIPRDAIVSLETAGVLGETFANIDLRPEALLERMAQRLLTIGLPANSGHGNLSAMQDQQTSFTLEQKVSNPESLPQVVLRVLRADKWNQETFQRCAKRTTRTIPSSWFEASKVSTDEGSSLLVVKPAHGCLLGANIGPFWVFLHDDSGYRLVFRENALQLRFLNARTNGYPDIRLSAATARQVRSVIFRFREGRYQPANNTDG
ncbi:MAG TPA: MCE family protein [Terriglobales bacterium]|nr:MCE family protein [Terriglobales bacterium]